MQELGAFYIDLWFICWIKDYVDAQTCKCQEHNNDDAGAGIDIEACTDMDFEIKIGHNLAK